MPGTIGLTIKFTGDNHNVPRSGEQAFNIQQLVIGDNDPKSDAYVNPDNWVKKPGEEEWGRCDGKALAARLADGAMRFSSLANRGHRVYTNIDVGDVNDDLVYWGTEAISARIEAHERPFGYTKQAVKKALERAYAKHVVELNTALASAISQSKDAEGVPVYTGLFAYSLLMSAVKYIGEPDIGNFVPAGKTAQRNSQSLQRSAQISREMGSVLKSKHVNSYVSRFAKDLATSGHPQRMLQSVRGMVAQRVSRNGALSGYGEMTNEKLKQAFGNTFETYFNASQLSTTLSDNPADLQKLIEKEQARLDKGIDNPNDDFNLDDDFSLVNPNMTEEDKKATSYVVSNSIREKYQVTIDKLHATIDEIAHVPDLVTGAHPVSNKYRTERTAELADAFKKAVAAAAKEQEGKVVVLSKLEQLQQRREAAIARTTDNDNYDSKGGDPYYRFADKIARRRANRDFLRIYNSFFTGQTHNEFHNGTRRRKTNRLVDQSGKVRKVLIHAGMRGKVPLSVVGRPFNTSTPQNIPLVTIDSIGFSKDTKKWGFNYTILILSGPPYWRKIEQGYTEDQSGYKPLQLLQNYVHSTKLLEDFKLFIYRS